MINKDILYRSMAKNAHIKSQFLDLPVVKAANINVWVDYGCADGEVSRAIMMKTANKELIVGYDREHNDNWAKLEDERLVFEHNFDKINTAVHGIDANVGVFLGSILHEAYTENVAPMVWEKVTQLAPSIVVVRDMMLWPEPGEGVNALVQEISDKASSKFPRHWEDFRRYWCKRGCRWPQALHFLLKYRYRANWSYELRENYLAMSPQALLRTAEEHGFYPVHMEAQSLDYLRTQWERDFGLDITHPTHGIVVFKNRRFA